MKIKKLDNSILIIILIFYGLNNLLVNYLFVIDYFTPINFYTHNVITGTLAANLIGIAGSSLIIFLIGKHNLGSMWFSKNKLKVAIALVISIWIICQVFIITYSYCTKGEIIFIHNFNVLTGNIIGQLFGNSLLEEMIFRGILLIQFYLIFIRRHSNKLSFFFSIIVSTIIFALLHIPNRLMGNAPDIPVVVDIISLLFGGFLLSVIFLKIKNLPFVIGFHSLVNEPFNIIEIDIPTQPVILIMVIIITLNWDKIVKKETEYLLTTS